MTFKIEKSPNKHKIIISYLPKSDRFAILHRKDLDKLNFRIWVINEEGIEEELTNRKIEKFSISVKDD